MEKARRRLISDPLIPLVPLDGTEAEISSENKFWGKITDTIVAQLRSKQYSNIEIAYDLHLFYADSNASLYGVFTDHTFPSISLAKKLSKLFELIPKEWRPTITYTDLSEEEIQKISRRIGKRIGAATSPKRKPERVRRFN